MKRLVFDDLHSGVALLYFAGVLAFAMLVFQPVYVLISLAGALAFSCCARGARQTLRTLLWQLPLVVLIALINPLFSASGSTELFRIGPRAIYLESLAYGACMGALLAATVTWCMAAAQALTSDRVLGLLGGRLPVIALMISMTIQLAEQLVRRGRQVRAVRGAASASTDSKAGVRARGARLSTVLVSWALEDSLERSDAMRARAWGAAPRRTSYRIETLHDRDICWLAGLSLLMALNAFLAAVAAGQWHFYPVMPTLRPWWGYACYVLLVLLPSVATVAERLKWLSIERKEPVHE